MLCQLSQRLWRTLWSMCFVCQGASLGQDPKSLSSSSSLSKRPFLWLHLDSWITKLSYLRSPSRQMTYSYSMAGSKPMVHSLHPTDSFLPLVGFSWMSLAWVQESSPSFHLRFIVSAPFVPRNYWSLSPISFTQSSCWLCSRVRLRLQV